MLIALLNICWRQMSTERWQYYPKTMNMDDNNWNLHLLRTRRSFEL